MKRKHPEKQFQDKDQFKLRDDDDEILSKVDKPLIVLRQIDRVNRLSAFGLLTEYVNSINHFESLLPQAHTDSKYIEALEKEESKYSLEKSKLRPHEKAIEMQLDAEFHRAKFQLLIAFMSRKGMW